MDSGLTASVIIPTYNRQAGLHETLKSLSGQTWPASHFEVIVVDDGSEVGAAKIASESFPFRLRYFRQANQGDAAARNTGAQQSQADVLVFLDDDIVVAPNYLASLIREHHSVCNRIVVGAEYLWLEETNPLDRPLPATGKVDQEMVKIPFADVCSNNMSIRREAYFSIGMMQGLGFRGSSIWCDVDFCYRAYGQGFEFYCSPQAICWHRDYVARSLDNRKRRMREVAYRAVALFQKYPDLLPYLPMFDDKTPITWRRDPLRLIVRKIVRHIASSRLVLWGMEQLVTLLKRGDHSPKLLHVLYRWIIGGYVFRGYRKGLQELYSVRN